MAEELVPGIFRIEIPLPRNPLRMLNAYLVKRGSGRHLLIDTGFNQPECLAAMSAALDGLGVVRKDLDFFITHLHADHSGLVADLCEGGARIYASEKDGDSINKTTRGPAYWTDFLRTMIPHGFSEAQVEELRSTHPAIRYCPSRELEFTVAAPGDILEYGGYRLHVLDGRGHTPGLLVLYEPENRILFSNDLILGDITPNVARWPGVADSLGDFLNSLAAMEKMEISLTLPAHRSIVHDARARIRELYAHHERRLDEVRRILRAGPQQGYAVASQMTWDMRGVWEDFPVPQKWFACGEALAHLDRLVALDEAEELRQDDIVVFALRGD